MSTPGEPNPSSRRGGPTAIVVGAGVSGCACAAVLAEQGIDVMVLNSALDRVNLPAYEPTLVGGARGWCEIEETMGVLPMPLRRAWLGSAVVPESGVPVLLVDRRAVSIETKRSLERMPGMSFRQGLVTDLRLQAYPEEDVAGCSDGKEEQPTLATVETVFGESFAADAVILAVGLGLGGYLAVGADSLPGGRYGETPADGLRRALEALGTSFGEAAIEVGARLPTGRAALVGLIAEADSGYRVHRTVDVLTLVGEDGASQPGAKEGDLAEARRVLSRALGRSLSTGEEELVGEHDAGGSGTFWPGSFPPAVHWSEDLALDGMIMGMGDDGVPVPAVSSDGRATREIHVSPEGERALRTAVAAAQGDRGEDALRHTIASRLCHVVRAQVLEGLGPDGRLTLNSGETPPVWVAGRAAGAASYLDSLRSGATTAAGVARALLQVSGV